MDGKFQEKKYKESCKRILFDADNMEFTHLHGHSTFSFLEAIGTPKQIVAKAKELGLKNIAITDFAGMYGSIAFYESAKKEDINPIVGTELGFVLDINGYNKLEDIGNICFLAKDVDGYNTLMKLVSHANQEGITGKSKVDIAMLGKYNRGIIAFMGGKWSWIGKMIQRSESDEKIVEIINMIQDKIGKENVFLEITAKDEKEDPDTAKINKKILELSEKHNIECIVNNVYHYLNKSDKEAWEMALAIKDGHKMYEKERRKPKGDFHIMIGEEIKDILLKNGYKEAQVKKRMEKNNDIASGVNLEIPMGQALFPNYNTPKDIKKIYDKVEKGLISK